MIPMRSNAVITAETALLLTLITVVSSIILYLWLIPLAQNSSSDEALSEFLKIEAVDVVKGSERVLAIQVYVRNIGNSPIIIDSMYIMKGESSTTQKCNLAESYKIEIGEVACVTGYPSSNLPPGLYRVKVVSKQGIEAVTTIKLTVSSLASKIFSVTTENTVGNEVTDEDSVAIYKIWVSRVGSNYKVWFRIYAKPGVTINYARAELFDKEGEHPDWVGGNPWEWTTPYTYPNWSGAEWQPVKESEFPVTVIVSIERG